MSWLVVLALTATNAVLFVFHILLRQRVARLEARGVGVKVTVTGAGDRDGAEFARWQARSIRSTYPVRRAS